MIAPSFIREGLEPIRMSTHGKRAMYAGHLYQYTPAGQLFYPGHPNYALLPAGWSRIS